MLRDATLPQAALKVKMSLYVFIGSNSYLSDAERADGSDFSKKTFQFWLVSVKMSTHAVVAIQCFLKLYMSIHQKAWTTSHVCLK